MKLSLKLKFWMIKEMGFFWHFDSRLVTEILKKMEGKLPDMAVNHIMARALQASYLMC